MIKAIIFDCFGVLVTEAWEPFCQEYFADDPAKLQEAKHTVGLLNTGNISYEKFLEKVAQLAGVSEKAAADYIDNNKPNVPLFKLIAELKSRYKIGMLSNAGGDWTDELFTPEQLALFDAVVLSYEVKVVKPNPEIYEIACWRLDVEPEEVLFVDDIERYAVAAEELGMRAIVYKDFMQFQRELTEILADSNA